MFWNDILKISAKKLFLFGHDKEKLFLKIKLIKKRHNIILEVN